VPLRHSALLRGAPHARLAPKGTFRSAALGIIGFLIPYRQLDLGREAAEDAPQFGAMKKPAAERQFEDKLDARRARLRSA